MSSLLSRVFGWAKGGKPASRPSPSASRPSGPQLRSDYSSGDTDTWTFPHQSVTSSNLASVAYDFPSQTLEIRFLEASKNTTGTARYSHVPLVVYRALIEAPSKGKYHWRHIRDHYPFHYV